MTIAAEQADSVTVPVVSEFGGSPIGWLRIRNDALPLTPHFVLALAYTQMLREAAPYELREVCIQTDAQYLRYLQSPRGAEGLERAAAADQAPPSVCNVQALAEAAGLQRRTPPSPGPWDEDDDLHVQGQDGVSLPFLRAFAQAVLDAARP